MNLRVFLSIVCLISVVHNTSGLNILGIFPYLGRSHFIVFRVFLQELSRRGHNVTVISHFPEKRPPKNYHDIPLGGGAEKTQDLLPVGERTILTHILVAFYLTTSGTDSCETLLANERVRNLVKKEQKFDVILVELFNSDCGYGLAYKLKAPVVAVTSHILMPWHYKRFGIPNNPSFVPYHFLEGGTKPTLYNRIARLIHGTIYNSLYRWVVQRNNQATLAKYYDDIPPLEELGRQAKFALLYQHYSLTGSILNPANVIEVGGYHVEKPKQLTGLRCGWRPGHISCDVLKKIEQHNCMKVASCCNACTACPRIQCSESCCNASPKCLAFYNSSNASCKPSPICGQPLIRITRHAGQYSITTKPSNISNAPSGPYPLKYVLNTDKDDSPADAKYSVEAKFNDYHFDYTSSQSSFVLDFTPPISKCYKPCPKKSVLCMFCQTACDRKNSAET